MLAAFVIFELALDRPPAFAFEQGVNRFYRQGEGLPKYFASWLIRSGLATDWAESASLASPFAYPLLRSAATAEKTYPYQTYTNSGQPKGLQAGNFLPPAGTRMIDVASWTELSSAIKNALAGDIISLAPGRYTIRARSIPVRVHGSASRPIYVRAESFGSVLLELDTLEGFHVVAPFWVFANLRIRGDCKKDSNCEHAFHVVGEGSSFTLRNSELVNFNAPIKVNAQLIENRAHYADNGLLEYNSFYNEAPRDTDNPVTLLNINAADGWVVRGNYIADFAKSGGNHVSYGAFMKGNGRSGIFERNLVICEHRVPADEGIRVGLSLGGGGTGKRFCKDQNCTVEFSEGVIRNNIILNCSRDVGIYLNRAVLTEVHHNLLFNNLGIDVRFETSSAFITNNIISGRIRNRDKGTSTVEDNVIARDCLGLGLPDCELSQIYQAPELGDFRLRNVENRLSQPLQEPLRITEDFCGRPLPEKVNVGPIQYFNGLECLATGIPTRNSN